MLHAVVMAGGSGTRFWPKSRRARPKQLLKLLGERTMIQETLDRVAPLVRPEHVHVITGADLAAAVREQLPEVKAENVVGEPCARDTAACVGLAALRVVNQDPDGTMLMLPADHRIEPAEAFRESIRAACEVVEEDPSTFVVFGVVPTRAETGYGYIERAEEIGKPRGIGLYRVARFQEKPNRETAERFLASGNFSWNAGIFVWKASAVLEALRKYQPTIAEKLDEIGRDFGTSREEETLARRFPEIPKMPIDRAVMETYPNVKVIEVNYDWNDVGDWRSLGELLEHDAEGNAGQGPATFDHTRGTLVIADDGQPIVTLGVENLVVVQSGGVTLVASRDRLDELKRLVAKLPDLGLGETL